MSVEVDVLLQEAKESIEAAQNYRSELQQRLQGLVRFSYRCSQGNCFFTLRNHRASCLSGLCFRLALHISELTAAQIL
uniref:Uncharacterized protein n=1 Tax=Astyanax mexicanus TaxID=7994 RepID=A0A3B1JY01_ASTMX